MPVLNNVANLGLILFLFLIALELDVRLFTQNWRIALSVGLAGMILPFGLGVAIAYGVYHQFPSANTLNFGVFALFVGTALAITAFPVLCRILSELRLLGSSVGVTVLAAGVGNDVVGWILLALCVALVNNASGLTALWVLLVAVGWVLFLVFAVRPAFHWVLRRTGSIQNGPTQGVVALTLLLVLTSAWFTSIIGVHAIFGGFLVGLICPHDGGFAIKLTEKIEDLITVLFLPLYFALSGLNTNLGLLNDGITWGYVIAIIVIAFAGKIGGGTLAARSMKLVWRESLTIGVLMSCKGLVELIVLNIGLEAGILTQKTFTMFVVMALVTTFATTPIVKGLYPPWYQKKIEAWKRGEIDWDGKPLTPETSSQLGAKLDDTKIRRLLVYLRLDSLPSLFTFVSLLGGDVQDLRDSPDTAQDADADNTPVIRRRPLEVHALRIVELTERTSSVMKVTESEEFSRRDPVVNAFKTFSQLNDVAVSSSVVVAPEDAYAQTVVNKASDQSSDFVLIPWSEGGSNTLDQAIPFNVSSEDRFSGGSHLDFIQNTLSKAVCNTGIFIGNGFSGIAPVEKTQPTLVRSKSGMSLRSAREAALPPVTDKSHHVFLPFIGGEDDRAALRFVLQLAKSPLVTVNIAHLNWTLEDEDEIVTTAGQGSVAEAKENIRTEITAQDSSLLASIQSTLPASLASRINIFEVSVSSKSAITQAVELAKTNTGQNPRNAGDIIVTGRRHSKFSRTTVEGDISKTIGVLGGKFTSSGLKASLLVIQAAAVGDELASYA
ncbi:Sodium/hydrogen exchanger family-domain-containing protein [Truncatella angustata]|uniref:Sodium/hydrogen exchanger family-domain-containing protein n=1 Tax=Truncatella angustata TaxID=152316 RepID=A0A9P8UDD2_9PEZI|nr:Sodium/hydrogen exchanger family-domain-containing protein [Truncatella angustata]KAH6647647.1 Sodium/hydrogen exchanger family-domain-containing protein [Truncatella angustata]